MPHHRRAVAALVSSLTIAVGGVFVAAPAHAYPPDPPPATEAAQLLAALDVREEGPRTGYDRDKFPHWSSQGNNCNTREVVLQRDGENVQVDDECRATSGRWYSVYDRQWLDSAGEIQIDHIVALAEAWDSGADQWTTSRREEFANDLQHSQLIAVSGSSNQEKSDKDPADWMPANDTVHCVYTREWIWVKSVYGLEVDQAEKSALEAGLSTC